MSSIPLPPGLRVNGFSMAPAAVTRAHSSPFGGDGAEAVVDLLQDRWRASFSTTATTRAESGAVEAWLAAQRGGANTTPLHHFARPYPLGTLGRQHAVYGLLADAAQGADEIQLATVPGATLLAGDMVGVSGLLLQCAADCVADGQGVITVPLVNRLRRALTGLRRASTATFVDGGGVLQTAAANVARFQGGQLLVEGAATNCALGTDSDALTTWSSYVTGAGAVTRQVVADPQFGNVLRLTKTSGAGGDRAGVAGFGGLAGMSGTSYVLSCWVRRSADALGQVYADAARLTGGLITAATLLSGAPAGQWTRLSAVGSNALGLAGGGTSYVWLDGPVGSTVDIKLPNVTLGTVLSSAFPAGAAPATRAADVISPAEWNKPTRPFRLASRAGVRHAAGYAEGLALDFVEDLTP